MVIENDEDITILMKPIKITKPSSSGPFWFAGTFIGLTTEESSVKMTLQQGMTFYATQDLKDVSVNIYHEPYITFSTIKKSRNECIDISKYWKTDFAVHILFKRLYMRSKLCFHATFNVAAIHNIKNYLPINFVIDVMHTMLGRSRITRRTSKRKTFLSNEGKGGFLVKSLSPDGYFHENDIGENDRRITRTGSRLLTFRQIPNNLITEEGRVVNFDAVDKEFETIQYTNEKRVTMMSNRLSIYNDKRNVIYDDSKKVFNLVDGSSSLQLKKVNADRFGMKTGYEGPSYLEKCSRKLLLRHIPGPHIICIDGNERFQWMCVANFISNVRMLPHIFDVKITNCFEGICLGEHKNRNKMLIRDYKTFVISEEKYMNYFLSFDWEKTVIYDRNLHNFSEPRFEYQFNQELMTGPGVLNITWDCFSPGLVSKLPQDCEEFVQNGGVDDDVIISNKRTPYLKVRCKKHYSYILTKLYDLYDFTPEPQEFKAIKNGFNTFLGVLTIRQLTLHKRYGLRINVKTGRNETIEHLEGFTLSNSKNNYKFKIEETPDTKNSKTLLLDGEPLRKCEGGIFCWSCDVEYCLCLFGEPEFRWHGEKPSAFAMWLFTRLS